jgi:hypothetical protein
MVGVRLPAARLKQVDKIAAARSCDRSSAIRWLLDLAMIGAPRLLLSHAAVLGRRDACARERLCQGEIRRC